MNKHPVIALRRHSGSVVLRGRKEKITLPPGCTGLCFCFESKKAAREYWGENTILVRIQDDEKNK